MNSRFAEETGVAVELGPSVPAVVVVATPSLSSSLSLGESERMVYPSLPSIASVRKQCEDRANQGPESESDDAGEGRHRRLWN